MSFAAAIGRDLVKTERELAIATDGNGAPVAQKFLYRMTPVACAPCALTRGTTVIVEGFEVAVVLLLIARMENFTSDVPEAGQTLMFPAIDGTEYRIARTRLLPSRTHLEIYLEDPNR